MPRKVVSVGVSTKGTKVTISGYGKSARGSKYLVKQSSFDSAGLSKEQVRKIRTEAIQSLFND